MCAITVCWWCFWGITSCCPFKSYASLLLAPGGVVTCYITNKTNKTVNMFFKTPVADRNTKTRVSYYYYYYYFNCGQLDDSNYSSVQLIIQKILPCVRVKRGQMDFNLAEHKHTSGWRPSNKTFKTLITLQVQRVELSWHVIRYIKTKLFSWQLVA